MLALTSHPVFANTRIVAPIAVHQTMPKSLKVIDIARNCGIDLFPVVTKNAFERALEKGASDGLKIGQGLGGYFSRAAEVL